MRYSQDSQRCAAERRPCDAFDFKDASIKEHLPGDWKDKVRNRMDNIDRIDNIDIVVNAAALLSLRSTLEPPASSALSLTPPQPASTTCVSLYGSRSIYLGGRPGGGFTKGPIAFAERR